jgi:hypothetical protein
MSLEGKLSPEVLDKYFMIKTMEDKNDWNTEKFRDTFKRALEHVRKMKEIQSSLRKEKGRSNEYTMNLAGNYEQRGRSPIRFNENYESRERDTSKERNEGYRKNYFEKEKQFSPNRRGFPLTKQRSSTSFTPSREQTTACAFCGLDHLEIDCSKFPNSVSRRNKCLKKELCYYCLKKGHFPSNCWKKEVCIFCKNSHHPALCRKRFGMKIPEKNCPIPEEHFDCHDQQNLKLNQESVTQSEVENVKKEFSGFGNETYAIVNLEFHKSMNPTVKTKDNFVFVDGNQRSSRKESLPIIKLDPLERNNVRIEEIDNTHVINFKLPLDEGEIRKGIG